MAKNKKSLFFGMICVMSLVGVFIGVNYLDDVKHSNNSANLESLEGDSVNEGTEFNDYHYLEYNGNRYKFNSSIVTILFMGVDSSDDDGIGQADSIQLYLLNRSDETMQVVSLSRDIMTPIRLFDVAHNDLGWNTNHLALAYAYGSTPQNGAMLTCQAVSRLLNNIPINYFVAVDLTKLSLVHNVVGELEVVIPNESLSDLNPDWTSGTTISLTKDNVELFLRSRDSNINYSNNDRMQRQMAYLNAYFAKISEMLNKDFDNTVSKLYNLSKDLITNISLTDVESFAKMLISYSYDESKDFHQVEGENKLGEFHDEFYVNQEKLLELLINLFYKGEE